MKEIKGLTVSEVIKECGVSRFTLKRWEKEKLLNIKQFWSEQYKEKIRLYSADDIKIIKWLKIMSGSKKTNYFYLRLLLEFIRTNKINASRLNWPLK